MIEIIKGATKKPVSSEQLIRAFERAPHLTGQLYIAFPIFATPEGRYPIDAVLILQNKGVVLIHFVEGRGLPHEYKDTQDDIYNKLEAKLRNHKSLMEGRELDVPISVITFAPAVSHITEDGNYPVCTSENIIFSINALPNRKFEKFEQVISVLQSISTILKGLKKREIEKPDSRGAKLQFLEDSIANLDNQQGKAVIETVDSVQRIRGLAGSGKTIVLALKAAYLHAQHPEWKIVVTFHTRSLKGQFRRLINTFTIEQTGEEPNWENLKIIQAWGSGKDEGIYYNFCKNHGTEYFDYSNAKYKFGGISAFDDACSKALSSIKNPIQMYDAILVDEAQDFPPSFLRLCFNMLGDKKRLVYAYDELQNLNARSLPVPVKIFGNDKNGKPLVTLSDKSQDIILKKCYRNSNPILTTAHAFGFGIYRDPDPKTGTGLIQMFDNSQLWEDVGYSVVAGELAEGKNVTLERTDDTSPTFLYKHSDIDDLIQFHSFSSEEEQAKWLVKQIQINLNTDELRVDDIIVINPDPLKTKNAVGLIRSNLFKLKINSHLAGVDTTPDIFFDTKSDSIVFTGIYRAKGNEAGMVYIINAHDCYDSFGNLATVRNQLFTAITRSKAWVRVLGVGSKMDNLKDEFQKVKDNQFRLTFNYPNADLRSKLNIVNRDMSDKEKRDINSAGGSLQKFLETVEKGEVKLEDFDPVQIEKLNSFLQPK